MSETYRKKVLCINLRTYEMRIYESFQECHRITGVRAPMISKICRNGSRKTKSVTDGTPYTFIKMKDIDEDNVVAEVLERIMWARRVKKL